MKKALWIGILVIALLIAVTLLLPPFINLAAYKAQYLPLVEEALQRKVDVGDVRLRIVPSPAIRLSALQISDNPTFSTDPFFTAGQVRLRLKFWPLLRGQFQIEEFVLEKPVVNLVKQPDGTFNFADMGRKKGAVEKKGDKEGAQKDRQSVRLSELIPAQVGIEQGVVTLRTKGQKPLTVQRIDVALEDFNTARPFPYRIAVHVPGLKPIALDGPLRYDESRGALEIRENRLKVQDVPFTVSGSVTDLTSVPRVNLSLANGGFEIKPIIQALSESGLTSKELEISGPMGLNASLAGSSNALTSKINMEFKGLKLKDKRALEGTVVGSTALTLPLGGEASPVRALRGNGQVTAKDGTLTNVDLISKIQTITGLIGLPADQSRGATTFKTLQTEFTLAGGVAEFKRLFLDSPAMEALGAGKMTLESPTLDVRLDVALSPEVSARAGSGKAATFFKDDRGRIVVPLKVTGPVKAPAVKLDAEKAVRKGAGQLFEQKKGELLERLFKR